MDEADRILNLDFEKEASEYFTYTCTVAKKNHSKFFIQIIYKRDDLTVNFHHKHSIVPTNCPRVFEDAGIVSPAEVHFCSLG